MNKFLFKRMLPAALLLASCATAHAGQTAAGNDAIYAWVGGTSTCYKLESAPKVTYADGAAVLTVDGKAVLTLPLTDGAQLKITYGEYRQPTAVTTVGQPAAVSQSGKYIIGGRLVIVKGDKWYDINGRELKH